MDLNEYALHERSEIEAIRQKVGTERFEAFKKATFNTLRMISIGERFPIEERVSRNNIPAFMKIACLYILETGSDCNIDIIGSESNIIKGIQSWKQYSSEMATMRTKLEERKQKS